MSVFDHEPDGWEELQDLVAQLFLETGCEAVVGKQVQLVRGQKEIDVWVQDPQTAPPSRYLCECKFWSRPIPQEVIHSFRTIVADYGAHRGFIISRVGFQAGAFEAVQNTNVDLLTFPELQDIFFDRWRIAMGERFMPYGDRLFPYWDFSGRRPQIEWNDEHCERNRLLFGA